jgi:DNA-binding IclR family transcriptional regulator
MAIKSPVLDLLSKTGPLPLAELNLRTNMSSAQLLDELTSLRRQGLIDVEGGDLPQTPEQLRTVNRVVRLTTRGTSRSIA